MRRALWLIAFALPLRAETGTLTLHMILHAIGAEHYELTTSGDGLTLAATAEYSDRGTAHTTSATLRMKPDYAPVSLEVKGKPVETASTPQEVTISGASPFSAQMVLMRYWAGHGKPKRIAVAGGGSIAIEPRGADSILVGGKPVALQRYTIDGLMFGREILWMNMANELAAAMTFAGGLPMEAIREEYEPALPQLYKSGVAQEMADLDALGRQVTPDRTGAFAIVGATLIDATGRAPIADSVVVVRDGRIVA